jgi:pimeloyl-ACP methyl ester carboxylesterase
MSPGVGRSNTERAEAAGVDARTLDIQGVRTAYLERGSPSSPPVVLVHDGGYGSDALTCWEPILPGLSERFHVIAPDLLGFGGTAKVVSFDENPLVHRLGHLAAFCRELGLERPALVGSSFGGALVLNAAARRTIPMSRGVTVCGTGGLFFVGDRFAALQVYDPSIEAARGIEAEMLPEPDEVAVRRRYEQSLRPGHWEALSASRVRNPLAEPPPDWLPAYRQALTTIDVPILIVAGSEDRLLEPGWEARMRSLIPGSTSLIVRGARHQPHRSHSAQVVDALVSFLGGP